MATCTAGWARTQATASWGLVAPRSAAKRLSAATSRSACCPMREPITSACWPTGRWPTGCSAAAPRGPAGPAVRRYLLAGLLACGLCGQGVDDLGQVGYLLYETRGATTLIGADDEPGPLMRDGIFAGG